MAKRVFFSFHYQDVIDFRANVVRNHWISKPDREQAGFFDASIWESARNTGDMALKRLINDGIYNTSNTCVLIGTDTYERRWVRYEILRSIESGNHLFGVHINSIKGKNGKVKILGKNPFDFLGLRISMDGTSAIPVEYKNYRWHDSSDFPHLSFKSRRPLFQCGRTILLSEWYVTYNWVSNDGFTNFSRWVK